MKTNETNPSQQLKKSSSKSFIQAKGKGTFFGGTNSNASFIQKKEAGTFFSARPDFIQKKEGAKNTNPYNSTTPLVGLSGGNQQDTTVQLKGGPGDGKDKKDGDKKAKPVNQETDGWQLPDWAQNTLDSGAEMFNNGVDRAKEIGGDMMDRGEELLEQGQEAFGNAVDQTKDALSSAAEAGKDFVSARPWSDVPANQCKRYDNMAEAYAAKSFLMTTLIPSIAATFGTEVASIWKDYVSGKGGVRTYVQGSSISNAFANSDKMEQRHQELMNLAQTASLTDYMTVPANQWVDIPVDQVFTATEINRPIDFNNPFDVPGNIAGGVGDGDHGATLTKDSRKLGGYLSVYRTEDADGCTTNIELKSKFTFEVIDTVDFCGGNLGADIEKMFTIPLSRLEATDDMAKDVGLIINFDLTSATVSFTPSDTTGSPDVPEGNRGRARDRTPELEKVFELKDKIKNR